MPRICGIDLDKSEARMVVLDGHYPNFELIPTNISRLALADFKDQAGVHQFQAEIQRFLDEYEVETVGIRERLSKGRMKGGTITFKIEGLIQMCNQEVVLISPATIRKAINAGSIDFVELAIGKYQHEAYGAAYCLLGMTA